MIMEISSDLIVDVKNAARKSTDILMESDRVFNIKMSDGHDQFGNLSEYYNMRW